MEGSTVSDFSIERILSPQLGHKPAVKDFCPDRYLQAVAPGGFSPAPGPVPVSDCLQFGGMCFGETFYYGTEFSRFYPNSGVLVHFSGRESGVDAQPLPGYHGYPHPSVAAQPPPPRQKARMRTVFTDTQTKHLEALFEISDYPAVEARAEVARSTGLSEETIRVWFKNQRARRKRQRSGSKVKSP